MSNKTFVRLLNPGNWDQYADTEFSVGDVWDIDFAKRPDITPPHVEDVIINSKRRIRRLDNILEYLLNSGITIFRGSPDNLFNGTLSWTNNGAGYLERSSNMPSNSVGFWIADEDLTLLEDDKHYDYPGFNTRRLPYVGFAPKIKVIPKGTLMRISLARWWKPEDSDTQERCYLQLSGWYKERLSAREAAKLLYENI